MPSRRSKPSVCTTCGKDFLALPREIGLSCSENCRRNKSSAPLLADDNELHWIAGLLEGEGYFMVGSTGGVIVGADMTDLDVLQKLQRLIGYGSITGPQERGKNKSIWHYRATLRSEVEQLLTAILPHMGDRRRRKIEIVLGYIALKKRMDESA